MKILYTIYAWIICSLVLITHFIFSFCFSWFYKDRQYANQRWSIPALKIGYFLCGIKLIIKNEENIPKNKQLIIVSNHQGLIDILTYLQVVKNRFSFLAKQELLNVPIVGWDMRMQGHIAIDRKNPRVAVKQLENVKKALKKGRSLIIFPEGTRSKDASILPFKKGAFNLATEFGIPVVPCSIKGSNEILTKGSLLIKPGTIVVNVGNLVEVPKEIGKELIREKAAILSEIVRDKIIDLQNQH